MVHILDFLITKYGKQDFTPELWGKYIETVIGNPKTGTFSATLTELEGKSNLLSSLTFLANLRYGLDPAPVINQNQTLGQAVKAMLGAGSHRVLVTDDRGDLVNILSQSRVVELISYLIGSIPKCAKPIEFLGLATKEVISVHENQTAFEAFCIMRERVITEHLRDY
jgi:CBS domain-containing protein